MHRYEVVKDFVYSHYNQIQNESLRTSALLHTNSVDMCITLLTSTTSYIECAKVAALLHDYAQYMDNCPHAIHAKKSSEFAQTYLHELHMFTEEEIEIITLAILHHSKKDEVHSSFCEYLKDADCLARYLENPLHPVSEARKKRIENCFYTLK